MFDEPVTIFLDKERHLKLTLGGMMAFKKTTGIDVLRDSIDVNMLTDEHIVAFMWACLLHEDRKLTLEDVGFMITPDKLTEIEKAITAAWGQAIPEGPPDPNLLSRPNG